MLLFLLPAVAAAQVFVYPRRAMQTPVRYFDFEWQTRDVEIPLEGGKKARRDYQDLDVRLETTLHHLALTYDRAGGIASGNERPDVFRHHLRDASDVRRDHRATAREGLTDDVGRSFGMAREREQRARREPLRDLRERPPAEEEHAIAERLRELLRLGQCIAVTEHDEAELRRA